MVDPDNIVLEHLRAIPARLDDIERKLDGKADAVHLADVERKLDGLTHVVISSLGSLARSFEALDKRVARLEREPV
jgi:hypothetical protein